MVSQRGAARKVVLECAPAAQQDDAELGRLVGVEVGQHLSLDLVHGAVAALERAASRFRQLDSDDAAMSQPRPPANVSLGDEQGSTSLIDWGVTSERRARWALESPSFTRNTERAV